MLLGRVYVEDDRRDDELSARLEDPARVDEEERVPTTLRLELLPLVL